MKSVREVFKRPVAVASGTAAVAAAIVSVTVLAARLVNDPSSNPWDYTLFAFQDSGTALLSDTGQLAVEGDVRSGGGASFSGGNVDITGNVVAGKSIEKKADSFKAGRVQENAPALTVNAVFGDVFRLAGGNDAFSEQDEITCNSYQVDSPIVGKDGLQLNISQEFAAAPEEAEQEDYKFGAFGAGFMSNVYENEYEWKNVLPFLFEDDVPQDRDLLKVGEASAFLPVGGQQSGGWDNYDKLPEDPFGQALSQEDIPSYLTEVCTDHPVFEICKTDDTVRITADYDRSTVDPAEAEDAAKIAVSGGNFALNGDYDKLEEIRFDNWGGAQLHGSYPNLRYIYMSTWSNLNIAGDFPALECVFIKGGQLLLGTGNTGFAASNAQIMTENGTIVLFTAENTKLEHCEVLTLGNIVFRGKGRTADASALYADDSLFAASGAISFEDMHDDNTEKAAALPVFYSGSPLSIVNSDFSMLQGCFIAQNGAAVLTESNIGSLRGYFFSPYGINSRALNSNSSISINTFSYNIDPDVRALNTQQSGRWQKGTIHAVEAARFPLELADRIMNASEFVRDVSEVKDENGAYTEQYRFRGVLQNTGVLTVNKSVFADSDIVISAGVLNGGGERLPVIASRTGDITITVDSEIDWNGIIFAPNGKVKISGSGTINGRIFAQSIELTSDTLTVRGENLDLTALGFAAPAETTAAGTVKTTAAPQTTAASATAVTVTTAKPVTVTEPVTTVQTTAKTVTTTVKTTTTAQATTTTVTTAAPPEYTDAKYEYDNLGRLIKVTFDEKNYITYTYDANGNITEVKKTVDGVTVE
ncbi:MAG: RHS repeat protein [Oscillospiraceae bacterium]|nr:RHS repeat protein [Oscillospiraceae bacterium]